MGPTLIRGVQAKSYRRRTHSLGEEVKQGKLQSVQGDNVGVLPSLSH